MFGLTTWVATLLGLALALGPRTSEAGAGTWLSTPANEDWNNPVNWSSGTVPNGPQDTATFGSSNETSVSITAQTSVSAVIFTPDAGSYSITCLPGEQFTFGSGGLNNASGMKQEFIVASDELGRGAAIYSATASFLGDATTFTTAPALVPGGAPGLIQLTDFGHAGATVFLNQGGVVEDGAGGELEFYNTYRLESAAVTNQGALVSGASGGRTLLYSNSTADDAVITSAGGTESGANGGITSFESTAAARNATLIAESGSNGGLGGTIQLQDSTTGDASTVEVFGNGSLDISSHHAPGVTIGSLAGDGVVFLGHSNLSIGSNGLSTTFSGEVENGGPGGGRNGSLTKVGIGTLTLSGANIYSGGTTVEGGTLLVANTKGSATGTGPVQVNAGTFGGRSNITGAVTIGSGSGPGATLAPGINGPGVLSIHNTLTFQGDGSYDWEVNLAKGQGDEVICKGATIASGAQFTIEVRGNQTLPAGTVFTVIENKTHQLISGTFANLPEGAILSVGGNQLQASYRGGDGNDLTLTVLP